MPMDPYYTDDEMQQIHQNIERQSQERGTQSSSPYGGTGASLAIEGCFERIVGGLIVWGGLLLVIIAAWQDPSNQGKVCLAMVFGPLLIYFAFRVRHGINRKSSA